MRPRSLSVSILTTLATAAALTAGPLADAGHAAPTTTISQVATPAPGHVTGTVTSDAPFVRVQLSGSGATIADAVRAVPADSHTLAFDLPTWGFPDAATIAVRPCRNEDFFSCEGVTDSANFEPIDVAPSVTWQEDGVIGPDDDPYRVTVTDPSGGGELRLLQATTGSPLFVSSLAPDGTTELPNLSNGTYDLVVQRCAEQGTPCRTYPEISTQIRVQRYIIAQATRVGAYFVGPDETSAPDMEATVWVSAGSDLTVTLQVYSSATGRVVSGIGTTVTGLEPDESGNVTIPLDLTGIRSGYYDLRGTVSYDDPEFGHFDAQIREASFRVDASAPVVTSARASASTIFPVADGYRDSVAIETRASDDSTIDVTHEIRDAGGALVRTLGPVVLYDSDVQTWDGRDATGRIVPSGRYTVTTLVSDAFDRVTAAAPFTITVSTKRLVQRTFTRTVTAKESLVAKSVGRCSTLKMPSARGWRGSMGLYTGTRCKGSIKATLVSTAHALRVPAALRYGSIRVTAYGGAAKAEPRSLAYLTYLHPKDGWGADTQMSTRLGDHAGTTVRAGDYLFKDGTFEWGAYTADGARYDIKNFIVRMTYSVLQ